VSDFGGPPRLAEALLRRVVPSGWAGESLIADLEEEFHDRAVRARGAARAWYWRATVQLAWAYLWDGARRHRLIRRDTARPDRRLGRLPHGYRAGLLQDFHFAVRSFLRTPGFTLLCATTLALGIGSATAVFSVADTLLLRPLPFPHADRLVDLWSTRPAQGEQRNVVAGATYLDWERDARAFTLLAAYRTMDFNVTGDGFPERLPGVSITPGFFAALDVGPILGRLPSPGDGPAAARTVVLSDAVWQERYGADPSIIGRAMTIDGIPHTIVAVLPPGVTFPEKVGLYAPSPYRVPLTPMDDVDRSADRTAGYLRVIGRLAEGISLDAAQAEMSAVAARAPAAARDPDDPIGVAVIPAQEDLVGPLRPTLIVFLGAVGLLLLIACANVANLLTVRALRRRPELAVRMSLGAGPARIRRQLLTEAIVLALMGGVPGLLLAAWGTRILVSLAPEGIPRLSEASVDSRVLIVSLLVTLATGLLFGLAPTVGFSGRAPSLTLRAGRVRRQPGPELLRDTIVVTEVALALLLVVGAGLMLRTYRAVSTTDPGFDPSSVLVAHVALPASRYTDDATQAAFYEQTLASIRALPGVESAATILTLPMHWAIRGTFHFSVEGRTDPESGALAGYQVASTDYFKTLRIPLLQGRDIAEADQYDHPAVVVINEAMAQRYWPGENPLGQRITFWGDPDDPATTWATIVGVVGNTAKDGLDEPPEPEAYLPVRQVPMPRASIVVRTAGDPYGIADAVRRCLRDVDASLPLYGVLTMEDVVAESLAQRRFRMILLGVFAGAALLLTAVGLYGVISFSVGQRTREIGIRMALGATRDGVVRQVIREGLVRVAVGLAVGAAGSLALTRVIASQVFGVSVTDPITYACSALTLGMLALTACAVPAIRASRVDPALAVRDA